MGGRRFVHSFAGAHFFGFLWDCATQVIYFVWFIFLQHGFTDSRFMCFCAVLCWNQFILGRLGEAPQFHSEKHPVFEGVHGVKSMLRGLCS